MRSKREGRKIYLDYKKNKRLATRMLQCTPSCSQLPKYIMHPMQDDNDGSAMQFRRSSQASARAADERMIAYPLPRNAHTVRFETMTNSRKKDVQGDLEVKHPNLQIQVDCFLPASTGATVSNPITPSPQPFRAAQSSRSSSSDGAVNSRNSINEYPFQQSQ